MGNIYLRNLLTCGVEIFILVFDINDSVLTVAKEKSDFKNIFFTNRQEIFFSKISSGDYLIITSPSNTHFFYLQKALDLQLNVLCEKPLGDTNKRFLYLDKFRKKNLSLKASSIESYFSKWMDYLNDSELPVYIISERISVYRGQNTSILQLVNDLLIHDLDHILALLRWSSIKNVEVDVFVKESFVYLKTIFEIPSQRFVRWLGIFSYQKRRKRDFFWKDIQNVNRSISFITPENILQKQILDFLQEKDISYLDIEYKRTKEKYSLFAKILSKISHERKRFTL